MLNISTLNALKITMLRNSLSILTQTLYILDVLYITVTFAASVGTQCQYSNVCDVQRHSTQDVWTKIKLWKYLKSNLFVMFTLRTRRTWRKLHKDLLLQQWLSKSSSRLKKLKLKKKKVLNNLNQKKRRMNTPSPLIITQQEEIGIILMISKLFPKPKKSER